MPTIEIDEVELQQSRKLKELVEAMAKDPRTRREFTKLVRTVNPESKLQDPPAEPWEDKLVTLEKQLADEPADGDADLKRLIETKGESMPLTDKMVREALADHRGHR